MNAKFDMMFRVVVLISSLVHMSLQGMEDLQWDDLPMANLTIMDMWFNNTAELDYMDTEITNIVDSENCTQGLMGCGTAEPQFLVKFNSVEELCRKLSTGTSCRLEVVNGVCSNDGITVMNMGAFDKYESEIISLLCETRKNELVEAWNCFHNSMSFEIVEGCWNKYLDRDSMGCYQNSNNNLVIYRKCLMYRLDDVTCDEKSRDFFSDVFDMMARLDSLAECKSFDNEDAEMKIEPAEPMVLYPEQIQKCNQKFLACGLTVPHLFLDFTSVDDFCRNLTVSPRCRDEARTGICSTAGIGMMNEEAYKEYESQIIALLCQHGNEELIESWDCIQNSMTNDIIVDCWMKYMDKDSNGCFKNSNNNLIIYRKCLMFHLDDVTCEEKSRDFFSDVFDMMASLEAITECKYKNFGTVVEPLPERPDRGNAGPFIWRRK